MIRIFQTALLCIMASVATLGAGDLKITYKTESKTIMTSKGTLVEFYSERYARFNNGAQKQDTLIDYKRFTSYLIDHKKKLIQKMALADMEKMLDLMATQSSDSNDESAILKNVFGDDAAKASVRKMGSEQVVGRACEKWEITLGKFYCKASADPSLVPPTPPAALENASKLAGGALMANPMVGKTLGKLYEGMSEIKGIRLKSETVVPMGPMTIKDFKEATEILEDPLPASVFELPKGYKEEDLGKKILQELEKSVGKKK